MFQTHNRTSRGLVLGVAVLAAAGLTGSATADIVNLSSGNSTASLDIDFGLYDWSIDGTSHLSQQWVWIRPGTDTEEFPIHHGPLMTAGAVSPASPTNSVSITYSSVVYPLDVTVQYSLSGGAATSGIGSLTQTTTVTHTGSVARRRPADFQLQRSGCRWIAGRQQHPGKPRWKRPERT